MKRADLLEQVAARIAARQHDHPLRVGIDGIDTAGKTSLADELKPLVEAAGCPVLRASIDGFHNPRETRYRQGANSPQGYYEDSFDIESARGQLLDPLGPGGNRLVRTASYNVRQERAVNAPEVKIPLKSILLFDGIFLARPELAGALDLQIFVHIEFETCLARAELRDRAHLGGVVRQRYLERYLPAQKMYLERYRPREKAAMVIINDDLNNPQLETRL
jgi:uridine kinase